MSAIPAPYARERVEWRSPRALSHGDRPALLAFRSDDFMAELEASLAASPPTTSAHLAAGEHWSDTQPPLFAVPARPTGTQSRELKLFQPAQGRFYLVSAHLCCHRYGFPDHGLADGESVGFVLRRVEPTGGTIDVDDPNTFEELAWSPADGGAWMRVSRRLAVQPGEQVLPLAPTVHTYDGRRSRLLTGLIPVGARERYEARSRAVVEFPTTDDGLANPHKALLQGLVIDAIEQLQELRELSDPKRPNTADLAEMLTWALLDLVDFITKVTGGTLAGVLQDHFMRLAHQNTTWDVIIRLVAEQRAALLAGEPPKHEPPEVDLKSHLDEVENLDLQSLSKGLTAYRNSLTMPRVPKDEARAIPDPDPLLGLQYVVRCVYQRATCAMQRPEWVSAPSAPFRFASFFDPDAPARPVQISLPIDTSQRGLRAFPRNVNILVSNQLRSQIQQIRKIDEFGSKQAFDLGMLCSLSIPIITISALILLMLIVGILNIVFFWVPLFKICLPKGGK